MQWYINCLFNHISNVSETLSEIFAKNYLKCLWNNILNVCKELSQMFAKHYLKCLQRIIANVCETLSEIFGENYLKCLWNTILNFWILEMGMASLTSHYITKVDDKRHSDITDLINMLRKDGLTRTEVLWEGKIFITCKRCFVKTLSIGSIFTRIW